MFQFWIFKPDYEKGSQFVINRLKNWQVPVTKIEGVCFYGNTVHVLLHIGIGWGLMVDEFAEGMWFNFGLNKKIVEGQSVGKTWKWYWRRGLDNVMRKKK